MKDKVQGKREEKRRYKNQRRKYPSRHFVRLSTAFLYSDVHRAMSDEAFRLLMLLMAQKRSEDQTDVGLTWAQIQESTGWNERKIQRAGDELETLGLAEKLLRVWPRDPQKWRLHTDTYNASDFDERLANGDIQPPKKRSMRRPYQIDHKTGYFKGSSRQT